MEARLAQLRSVAQKDKAPAYSALLSEALTQQDSTSVKRDVHTVITAVLTEDHVGIVAGRQVLSELVKYLAEGTVKDSDVKKEIIKDTLTIAQPRLVSFEEQVSCVWLSALKLDH